MTVSQRSGPATSTPASTATPAPPSGEHDLISTASSALRRFHFKSAGGSRVNKDKKGHPANMSPQQVPKVVIMGSSTTSTSSNNTINTSTDSANTVTTLVNATDGETDAENPVVNLDDALGKSTSLEKEEEFQSGSSTEDSNPGPPPPTPLLGASQKEPRFIFVRTEAEDDDDEDGRNSFSLLKTTATVHNGNPQTSSSSKVHRSRRSKSRRKNHSSRKTIQPPDLRVDFFSEGITPVVVVEDGQKVLVGNARVAGDLSGGDKVVKGLSPSPSVKHKKSGKGSSGVDKTTSSSGGAGNTGINITGTPPTVNTTTNPLGIASANLVTRHHQSVVVQQSGGANPTVATVLLKNSAGACSGGVIGVPQQETKTALLVSKATREDNMKQLLDVATTLTLQELHDFEMRYGSPHHSRSQSVKTPGSRSNSGRPNYLCLPQQRSRVASMPNTGVEEEYYRLRHFSITGKGIVNRGDSLKSRRSRSNTSVTSSNSSHSTEHLTTAVNAGPTGVNSHPGSARTSATASLASSRESSTSNPGPTPYRVVMLGSAGVGKSSLISQFMTSEYLHAYDTSIDDEFGEKSVSVLLDGEESELTFIDHPCAEMSPENCITTYEPNAYCVVYSIVDRASLRCAEETLQYLWKTDSVSSKAVILVANKTDLVRSRTVATDEGKSMATSYDCKFIETSVGINHNVDELLVGILTQIRLKLENPERTRDLFRKRSCSRKNKNRNKSPLFSANQTAGSNPNSGHKPYRGSRTSTSLKVKGLLGKVWARDSKSKSCENLHVL